MLLKYGALLALLALGITGCNSASTTPAPFPCPQIAIAPPIAALVSPLAGATAVPTTIGRILLQTSAGTTTQIVLGAGNAIPVPLGTPVLAPSPLPSPLSTPLGSSQPVYAVQVNTLTPNTTYTVSASVTFGGGACAFQTATTTVGTFST